MASDLFDVIDQEQAEALIEQHDRYSFRGLDIARRQYKHAPGWIIYHNGVEVHVKFENTAEVVEYGTLAEALNECSLANIEKWLEHSTTTETSDE